MGKTLTRQDLAALITSYADARARLLAPIQWLNASAEPVEVRR